ncbi:MAG TPA: T9SS type A sorting domain-containing protein [Candidatus Krumholzibacteria bacterium]|nr:T9SS type A sorting domain-containing protein [Candidatus Krumholzibacteria bacterium]
MTGANGPSNAHAVSDGAGGAIAAWMDFRNGNFDIYAQRIDASGVVQWTNDGVAVCTDPSSQETPTIASDGAGGAIITWFDFRNGTFDIYAQRINAAGTAQWTLNGVAVCTAANDQLNPIITSDGAGGAIVCWQDARSGSNSDIYAQRINAPGVVQWTANGVAISAATNDQYNPAVESDGAGGAVVTWLDHRSGTNDDIYAQRVDASGAVQWTMNGVAVCTDASTQQQPAIASDGTGGAIITWSDNRYGTFDIYAQRVNAAGAAQWDTDGAIVCLAPHDQQAPKIVADGANGAIVAWTDGRNGVDFNVYAQRVGASGAIQWMTNGVALCAAVGDQQAGPMCSDGAGGAIVTWGDKRGGVFSDVYAQRISASGAVQWTADGAALCTAADDQNPGAIVSNGTAGAIVIWGDTRGISNVYAQRVEGTYGYWGHPEPIVASVADIPNDQGGKVAINWMASGRDVPTDNTIDYYSIWRAVDMASVSANASAPEALVTLDRVTIDTPPGARMLASGSSYYWELVGTQQAFRWSDYSYSAATRADSLASNSADETFMVAAHALSDDHIAFASNAVSGHSVDNLAPAAPLMLTAQRVGADVNLKWNRVRVSDLKNYAVYRGTSSGVTPIQSNFLTDDTDTVLVDTGAPATSLYYIVTAYDVHQNQSKPSNEANVSGTSNAGDLPPVTALMVLQNHPNPFVAETELEIGLPADERVQLDVYDVAGRRVREETVAGVKGWQEVPFAGVDDHGETLASGVYFYKVSAGGKTITHKMLITR